MMDCPKCGTAMLPMGNAHEERCIRCGYWFDQRTGKEIEFNCVKWCLVCDKRQEECTCAKSEFEFDAETIQQWIITRNGINYCFRYLFGYVVVGRKPLTPLQFLHWIERDIFDSMEYE